MADKVLRPVEYSDETQELLRNSLLKLNARIGDLGPIENVKGCSFNYQIFVNERGAKAVTDNHTEVRFLPLLIRVRWVMEFPTWDAKINFILPKKIMGFKEISVFCELT